MGQETDQRGALGPSGPAGGVAISLSHSHCALARCRSSAYSILLAGAGLIPFNSILDPIFGGAKRYTSAWVLCTSQEVDVMIGHLQPPEGTIPIQADVKG